MHHKLVGTASGDKGPVFTIYLCWGRCGSCTERDFCLLSLSFLPFLLLIFLRRLPLSEREKKRPEKRREMGNCQAIDAAALVIQHPSGKLERLYWPVSANEVMKTNPGHYVSLIIPLPASEDDQDQDKTKTVRFTRVKLLRPTDTLALGHAYRLVTTQDFTAGFVEVMKVLRAKKFAKTKQKQEVESAEMSQTVSEKQIPGFEAEGKSDKEKKYQVMRHERQRVRTPSMSSAVMRSKSWRPSLLSISEAGS
ncbi:uncharacterized protein LOC121258487 isoform X1 [Juglans microcarpa x Juglans regia]|uniref:uncharacterized protein LOC121258487 isoform X1 n=1 Tax=Juglans microcarpa x Juglans regia TaxID=2249226 RepID=UPI001B7E96EB|nr:uncharacterized protein LOC121258487 isoform X1 [Juglans microcarpa x Juglans regia]